MKREEIGTKEVEELELSSADLEGASGGRIPPPLTSDKGVKRDTEF